MTNQEIAQAELLTHDIKLCTGCGHNSSHKRGFATVDSRTIHYNKKLATRATLYGFLHEVGHIVHGHGKQSKLRRFEKEREAEEYARQSLRQLGIAVPSRCVQRGNEYVARMKRFGDNVRAGLNNPWRTADV